MQQEKKITYSASPLWVILLVFILGGLAGGAYYYISTQDQNDWSIKKLNTSNGKLKTEVAQMTGRYSTSKLDVVRQETDTIKATMISGREADSLMASLRPNWVIESRSDEANTEFTHRRYTLVRGAAEVAIWPEVQAVLEKLKKQPNLALNHFKIQTTGDSRKRNFSRITVSVSIYIRNPETAS